MFDLSSKTQVNRRFRFTELYKMMAADKDIKADAKNILSVFAVELSDKTIPALFLSALDRAINLHTVFILRYGDERTLYGAYKEKTEKGVKVGKYYSTGWTSDTTPIPLPLNVNRIDDIYTSIIDELIPITARTGEETGEFVARYDRINKLKKEIEKKQRQVDTERQSKRRF